jgi:hypothetical protein
MLEIDFNDQDFKNAGVDPESIQTISKFLQLYKSLEDRSWLNKLLHDILLHEFNEGRFEKCN